MAREDAAPLDGGTWEGQVAAPGSARDWLVDRLVCTGSREALRLLREGAALRLRGDDEVVLRPHDDLLPGDRVRVQLGARSRAIKPRKLPGFEVLYEDAAVLAVQKPAGVSVTLERGQDPEDGYPLQGALLELLESRGDAAPQRPRIVHRLDRDTSGVLLVAKHREALQALTRLFEERKISKRYLALVQGVPRIAEGVVDLPIGAARSGGDAREVDGRDARTAKTHYEVLERFKKHAWLALRPEGGRQHQIRVHMQAVGHPLAVDPRYGGEEALLLSRLKPNYKTGRGRTERPLVSRLTLHAAAITFETPDGGEQVTVEAELPKDLRVTLKQLRKYAPYRGR